MQTPSAQTPGPARPPGTQEPGSVPGQAPGGVRLPPRIGWDLLYAPPAPGPITFTPSLTISEEFNDNVFLSNEDKRSDFITQFTPAFTLALQQPGFQLTAGYSFTAAIYANEDQLNDIANRHNFLTQVSWAATPQVTLSLMDRFTYDRNSYAASVSGISSGRREAFSNVFGATADFKVTQRATWNLSGAYTLEGFGGADSQDSSVYHVGTGFDYVATPRLTLTAGYSFEYFDIEDETASYTHTSRVGGTYQITPTLSATLSGGPSVLVSDGDSSVSPAVTASLSKVVSWGSMGLFYDRSIGTAGRFGGPSDNQTFGGNITAATFLRGLFVDFSPRYTISKTDDTARSRTDIEALTLNVSFSYQLARYVAIVGAYTFLNQRTSGDGNSADVDQNRISLGLQFGYPIGLY
jgi:hypothetical protein